MNKTEQKIELKAPHCQLYFLFREKQKKFTKMPSSPLLYTLVAECMPSIMAKLITPLSVKSVCVSEKERERERIKYGENNT